MKNKIEETIVYPQMSEKEKYIEWLNRIDPDEFSQMDKLYSDLTGISMYFFHKKSLAWKLTKNSVVGIHIF